MNDRKDDYKVEVVRQLLSPPAKVFAAWRDVERMRRWFCPAGMSVHHVEVDFRVGGRYLLQMKGDEIHTMRGEYREIVPDRKLVFTWLAEKFGFHETLVTIELTPRDGGTELRLEHRYFLDDDERARHAMGWDACLDHLASQIATL